MRVVVAVLALLVSSAAAAAVRDICGFEAGDYFTNNQDGEHYGFGDSQNSISTTTKRSGSYAYKTNCNFSSAGGTANFTGREGNGTHSPNWVCASQSIRFYVNFETLPASNDSEFLVWSANSDPTYYGVSVRVTSTGVVKVYRGTGYSTTYNTLIATGTTALSTGTWYRINFRTNDSNAWSLAIDGTTEVSGTELIDPACIVSLGRQNPWCGCNSMVAYYDDLLIDTSDTDIPAGQVVRLAPNANGTGTAWTDGDGDATGDYTDVDDAPGDPAYDSLTSYVLSTTNAQVETANVTDSSTAGISGTINAVKSIIWVRRNHASATTIQHRLVSNGSNYDTTDASLANGVWTTLGSVRGVDPYDSGAWTTTDIDGLQVGVENTTSPARESNFTAAAIMVDFSPAAAVGSPGRQQVIWWGN